MKNLLLVYVILLGCFSANAQEFVKKFRIEGHIKGLETPDGKMYLRGLVNANGVNQTDTVEVHTVCVYQGTRWPVFLFGRNGTDLCEDLFQACRISELY